MLEADKTREGKILVGLTQQQLIHRQIAKGVIFHAGQHGRVAIDGMSETELRVCSMLERGGVLKMLKGIDYVIDDWGKATRLANAGKR